MGRRTKRVSFMNAVAVEVDTDAPPRYGPLVTADSEMVPSHSIHHTDVLDDQHMERNEGIGFEPIHTVGARQLRWHDPLGDARRRGDQED